MSTEDANGTPHTEDIPAGATAEASATEGILPYPSVDADGEGTNDNDSNGAGEENGSETEEEEDKEYIVPEVDLDEVIDNMGHFKRVPSKEKASYPPKADILTRLQELHEPFNVNEGFATINLEDDEIYYLVAKDYALKLCDWLSSEGDEIPDLTIDNSNLFTNGQETLIRKNSLTTFSQLVSAECWAQLVDWFGGGVSIRVKSIRGTVSPAKLLRVVCGTDNAKFRRFYFNAHETVENAKEEICEAFGVEADSARLHDFFRHKPYARIDKMEGMHLPLQKKQLLHNNLCYLEVKNERDKFTIKYKKKPTYIGGGYTGGYTGFGGYGFGYSAKDGISGSKRPKGLVGLNNLGNTCYMNSILQCLSNTPLLKEPFLSKAYEPDINETNVLGYKGEVAKAFYNVMKLMWSGKGSVVRPAGFKKAINDAKTDFRGYQQHDSQEFLSQLLDAMHEDLNRVVNKPITEKVETNGRPDQIVAAESMATFKMRNDSIITDLFTGLYKSTVTCPDETCGNVSVTFDPYMIIPLPLQAGEKAYQVLQVVFVPRGPDAQPYKTEIIAPKHGPFYLLREILKDKLGINELNAKEMHEMKSGKKLKVSDDPNVKTALGYSEDDEDVAGKRDIIVFQTIGSRLNYAPLNNKTGLSDLSKDIMLICYETFDYLSFEYFNFHPNTDWKRELTYPRTDAKVEETEDKVSEVKETEEEGNLPPEAGDEKSEGEDERPQPIDEREGEPADDGPIQRYPNLDSDDGQEDDEENRNRPIPEPVEVTEVPDEEKIQIGLPNCPFLVGDVWHGNYNHNTDQQHLRVEILGVERMDWSAYSNYKAEVIEKYGEQNLDVQLDEKEFVGRKVFFVHAQADSKEQLSQYMSSAFRGRSQTQFELKGVYITNADDEEEIDIPQAKPIVSKVKKESATDEEKSEEKSQGSDPKQVEKTETKEENNAPKDTTKQAEKTLKPAEGKKKGKSLFNRMRGKSAFGKKNKGKGSAQPETDAKDEKKAVESSKAKEKKTSEKSVSKRASKKLSKTEETTDNLYSIANKLIPGQMEKKYLHGSFVLRPTDKREIIQAPTSRYGGFTNYYSSAYQTSSFGRQDTSREPIVLQGSVESHFRYMWGKFQVDKSFTKGQFTCQRYESMNWNNHLIEDTSMPDQVVKNWSKFPYPLNQDNRLLVLLCHKTDSSGFRTIHSGIPEAFFAPTDISESELMDMLKARFRIYFNLEVEATGVNRTGVDEETGEEIDLVERHLQSLVIKRASKKFEATRYTSLYSRSAGTLVGQELDAQEDSPANRSHEPILHLLCEWPSYPFTEVRPENVFHRESNETKMTLHKALDLFSQTDRLNAMNAWYCNKCKDHKEAYKQLQLWSVPKVLVIQFKRFSQEETRMRADKLEIPVEFPFDIDLSDYTLSSKVAGDSVQADIEATNRELEYHYELVAVSSHLGGGLGSGHYVACAKNENDGHWYDFNDSSVSRIPDDSIYRIVNPQAYVLFYVRKSELEARKVVLERRKQEEANNPTPDSGDEAEADASVPVAEVVDEDATEIGPPINVDADEDSPFDVTAAAADI